LHQHGADSARPRETRSDEIRFRLGPGHGARSECGAERGSRRTRRAGGEGGGGPTVQGLPLIKPPYWRITALDMNKGTLAWQIAHGDTPDNIKNNPALKGLTIPRTGRQG